MIKEQIILNRPIPFMDDYKSRQLDYNFWHNSFEVNKYYVDSVDGRGDPIIIKHPCESLDDYNRRKRLAYCPNYSGNIIQRYNSFIFKNNSFTRNVSESDVSKEFVDDCDLYSTSLNDFEQKKLLDSQIFGKSYILLDVSDENTKTMQGYQSLIVRPYLVDISNESVINEYFINDYLQEILLTMEDYEGNTFVRYYNSTIYKDIKIDKDKIVRGISEDIEHNWSNIPVVVMKPSINSTSQMDPLAQIQSKLCNLICLTHTELMENCFSRWFISSDTMLQNSDDSNKVKMNVGNNIFALLPSDSKLERISNDKTVTDQFAERIVKVIEDLLYVGGMRSLNTSANASGTAREIQFESEAASIINLLMKAVAKADNAIFSLLSEAFAFEYSPTKVYPVSLANGMNDDLKSLMEAVKAPIVSIIKRKLTAEFIEKYLALTPEELSVAEEEIAALAEPEIIDESSTVQDDSNDSNSEEKVEENS